MDTLETASAFGLSAHPRADETGTLHADMDSDPHRARGIRRITDARLPLAFAVNSLNRSMGQPDLCPFVLPPAATGEPGFIHDLVHARRAWHP